jgi:hypothetical protein
MRDAAQGFAAEEHSVSLGNLVVGPNRRHWLLSRLSDGQPDFHRKDSGSRLFRHALQPDESRIGLKFGLRYQAWEQERAFGSSEREEEDSRVLATPQTGFSRIGCYRHEFFE